MRSSDIDAVCSESINKVAEKVYNDYIVLISRYIRYDTIEEFNVNSKSLTWTQKLSVDDQLNLAHVARNKYDKEETKTNKLYSVQVNDIIFIPSTSFCSLSSWFTSSCTYHLITVTTFTLITCHCLYISLQTKNSSLSQILSSIVTLIPSGLPSWSLTCTVLKGHCFVVLVVLVSGYVC